MADDDTTSAAVYHFGNCVFRREESLNCCHHHSGERLSSGCRKWSHPLFAILPVITIIEFFDHDGMVGWTYLIAGVRDSPFSRISFVFHGIRT
jgi:hypothetical protein